MRYYLAFWVLCNVLFCNAQDMKFNNLNIGDGLSQNSVLAITQDKQGFLWFGTRNGLNKYDSHQFKSYHTGSEEDNYITALLCDAKGTLWVGSRNGLKYYDRTKDRFVEVSLTYDYRSDASSRTINHLYEDKKGRIWVSTEFTLNVLEKKGGQMISHTVPVHRSKNVIRCVYEDHEGIFWVATSQGLVRLLPGGSSFKRSEFRYNALLPESLSSDQVTSITEDGKKQLWVATLKSGLNLFNRNKGTFKRFSHNSKDPNSLVSNNIRRLQTDQNGDLWIGTQEGLSVLDVDGLKFANYINDPWNKNSLSQNSIHSLFRDYTGNMWVGTFFGGINTYFAYNTPFRVYSNRSSGIRLNNNVISSIVEDNNAALWIGTEGGGVNQLQKSGQIAYYTNNLSDPGSLGSNLVKLIFKDRENRIWIGTHGGGLNLFDRQKRTFSRYLYEFNETVGSEITSMIQDSSGRFWIGTETQGIRVYRKAGEQLIFMPVPSLTRAISTSHIFAMKQTSGNAIWIGGRKGLFIVKEGNAQNPVPKPLDTTHAINCIFQSKAGSVWVGSNDNGLLEYTLGGTFLRKLTRINGLADNKILGILEDDRQNLWISTGNGLCRFRPGDELITTYTEADGLPGNVFNNNSYFKSSSGELFFGGYSGLVSFQPNNIQLNTAVPPVHINGLFVHGEKGRNKLTTVPPGSTKTIELRYDENIFNIDVAVLNYIKSPKNTYKYKLAGYDKDWNYTRTPLISYTNVAPGQYHFMVSGANNDNIWGKNSVLHISILPPWWKSWWAYTIYAAGFALLVFFIARFLVLRALYNKDKEITQLKLNFFTNISHEIRTHLSLIIAPVENLIARDNQDPYDKNQLITVKNNSESLLQLVNELMDFRRAETGHLPLQVSCWNIVPFVETIFSSFHDLSISKNIQTSFICEPEVIEVYFDKEQLEKVVYNLIFNAFKFTPASGNIWINIEDRSGSVEVRVNNNGKGISEDNIQKLFDNYFQENDYGQRNTGYGIGLALSKSIVELHKGGLTATSIGDNSSKNTCFTLSLLKGNKHFEAEQLLNKVEENVSSKTGSLEHEASIFQVQEQLNVDQTILIVEDNVAIRSFIANALREHFKVLECCNGKEGWECATVQIPDLIISDVMMPEMDGIELSKRLKEDERTSHIPLILLTAKNTPSNQVSGLKTGADLYLTKPFSLEVLNLQVRNLLRSREALWAQFQKQFLPGLPEADEKSADTLPITMHPLDEEFISKITAIFNEYLQDADFGVALISRKLYMSQPVINKKIKAITGLSANDFVKTLRLKRAAQMLRENRYTVYEIAFAVGYENSKYFSREFRKYYHKTPSEYASIKEV